METRSRTAAEQEANRDSRHSLTRNTYWSDTVGSSSSSSVSDKSGRGKKGRIDQILSKEDFLPNRGKKRLLRPLQYLFNRNHARQGAKPFFYPKRGKKTRQYPKSVNSRPLDLMWLTKDDFYPHRGKRFDNTMTSNSYLETDPLAAYDEDDDDVPAAAEEPLVSLSSDGVILSDVDGRSRRDLISVQQNREPLSNLSKQELRDKWRGRSRSVQADIGGPPDANDDVEKLRSTTAAHVVALNEVIDHRYLWQPMN